MMKLKKILSILLMLFVMFSLTVNLYANTYINNSIEIEVSPEKRSYDYGDNVAIIIGIKNKNRYGKLHYKITEIYSGGGFVPLNLNNDETIDVTTVSEYLNSVKIKQILRNAEILAKNEDLKEYEKVIEDNSSNYLKIAAGLIKMMREN